MQGSYSLEFWRKIVELHTDMLYYCNTIWFKLYVKHLTWALNILLSWEEIDVGMNSLNSVSMKSE